ncbi:glycosyltransferase [Candidatus Pacearchaeota archaeon]|nr:glycosyltransferase [Candidatus Pacearchaeota archaeon]
MSLNIGISAVTGTSGYGKIGNEFTYNLYEKYTKNIQMHTVPDPWINSPCAHTMYQPMMLELMANKLDEVDLLYFLWTPYIIENVSYPVPVIIETMHELTYITEEFVDRCNITDITWVPSKFCLESFKRSGVENVELMPPGVVFSNDTSTLSQITDDNRFKFLYINTYSERKFSYQVLQAFMETFSATDDVVLYIRSEILGGMESIGIDSSTIENDINSLKRENPDSPQIVILTQFTDEILHKLYNSVDLLLSPSRGEGLGFTAIEAMSHGVPAITTNWSASTEYCRPENGFQLDYILEYPKIPQLEKEIYYMTEPKMQWANPDYLQLCEYMSYAYDHPEECKKLGMQASKDVRKQFDWAPLFENRIESMENLV